MPREHLLKTIETLGRCTGNEDFLLRHRSPLARVYGFEASGKLNPAPYLKQETHNVNPHSLNLRLKLWA